MAVDLEKNKGGIFGQDKNVNRMETIACERVLIFCTHKIIFYFFKTGHTNELTLWKDQCSHLDFAQTFDRAKILQKWKLRLKRNVQIFHLHIDLKNRLLRQLYPL